MPFWIVDTRDVGNAFEEDNDKKNLIIIIVCIIGVAITFGIIAYFCCCKSNKQAKKDKKQAKKDKKQANLDEKEAKREGKASTNQFEAEMELARLNLEKA